MEYISINQSKELVIQIAKKLITEEPYLTEIDRKIGDGDHGLGMEIGMKKILEVVSDKEYSSLDILFQDVGMAMINSMGGASGVLFGSLFLGMSKVSRDQKELDATLVYQGLNQALNDIKKRGKAEVGDKTMVDALEPAVESLAQDQNKGLCIALAKAAETAKAGVETTKKYVAKYGRAKNLGERAVGFQDAGATSVYLIIQEMSDFVCQY